MSYKSETVVWTLVRIRCASKSHSAASRSTGNLAVIVLQYCYCDAVKNELMNTVSMLIKRHVLTWCTTLLEDLDPPSGSFSGALKQFFGRIPFMTQSVTYIQGASTISADNADNFLNCLT